MTTHLESRICAPAHSGTSLSRFPAGKVGGSLLSAIRSPVDCVIIVDATRRIVLVNQRAERLFGYSAEDLLEQPLDVLMPARAGSEQRKRIDRLAASRTNGRRVRVELTGVRAGGEQLLLNASLSRISVHGDVFLVLILHDDAVKYPSPAIRQHPSLPADLRYRAVSSQQATEVEKRRFSKKLYDDIGQRLSVLKLDLDWLEHRLADTSGLMPARVAEMQGMLDHVITMTKSMASALRPPLLDDFGLLAAVEWMAENFSKKTGVSCMVESGGLPAKAGDPVESALFRVVQEGLSNIERHAHARNVKITFACAQNRLDVMIHDDGIGMASGSDNKPGCYGLMAMQERIFVLGGTISIRNVQPHGLAIHVSIPAEPTFVP